VRIIGGIARSRTIEAPRGRDTRPTLDHIRESLFNILQGELEGARVLDLFAGSGALALEALSRGAQSAVMADVSRQAVQVIKSNVEKLGFSSIARVIQADWQQALTALSREQQAFDLVFLDPPYEMTNTGEICRTMLEKKLLAPNFLVVVEHARQTPPVLDGAFRVLDVRSYKDTVMTYVASAQTEGAE